MAMWNLMEGMRDLGHEVHVAALNTIKQYCPPGNVPDAIRSTYRYTLFDADIRYRPLSALLHQNSTVPYHVRRFQHEAMEQYVERTLVEGGYDLVVAESLYAAPVARVAMRMGLPIVLRAHNAEHVIWSRLARSAREPLRRALFAHMARRILKYELAILASFHACACISQEDIAMFREAGSDARIYHAPLGLGTDAVGNAADAGPDHVIYHMGSMEWLPHREAMAWFLTQVWPIVHATDPRIRCHLAGKGIGRALPGIGSPGIVVHHTTEDARSFARERPILIAPSFSGSGVMVKVVEAMLAGKAIITTPNGARGLSAMHDLNMMIGSQPEEWAAWIVQLANDRAARQRLGEGARRTAINEHGRTQAARMFLEGIG